MGKKNFENYKRLQFDASSEAVKKLDDLVEKTGSGTRAEVIRNALRTYDYLLEMKEAGYKIQAVRESNKMKRSNISVPLPIPV